MFIFGEVLVSAIKIFSLPLIRETLLPVLIPEYSCSASVLKLYWVDAPHVILFSSEKSSRAAFDKFNCQCFRKELGDAGLDQNAPSVSEALLGAARAFLGRSLLDAFRAVAQDTDFVLAQAVYQGRTDDAKLLVSCGCDLHAPYRVKGRLCALESTIVQRH